MERLQRRREKLAASLSAKRISEIVHGAVPNRSVCSLRRMEGGASNLNYLIRFVGTEEQIVLRIHTRDRSACTKEFDLLRAATPVLPVPEIIHAETRSNNDIGPYLLYRYAKGITFQELKAKGSPQDTAAAARAIGETVARIQKVTPPPSVPLRAVPWPGLSGYLQSPLLGERLDGVTRDRLANLIADWTPQLRPFYADDLLVHGDCNNRNIIVNRESNRWKVAAILDWELAYRGSPWWDAARFVCYERQARPCREPYFSTGLLEAGAELPENWTSLCRVINAISAAESLSRPDLPKLFIPELRELIVSILAGQDPP